MRRCLSFSSARSFWNFRYTCLIQQNIRISVKDRAEQKKETEIKTSKALIIDRAAKTWSMMEIDHEIMILMSGEDLYTNV